MFEEPPGGVILYIREYRRPGTYPTFFADHPEGWRVLVTPDISLDRERLKRASRLAAPIGRQRARRLRDALGDDESEEHGPRHMSVTEPALRTPRP